MTDKLLPVTVMLSLEEISQLKKEAITQKRSNSSILRISLLAYLEGRNKPREHGITPSKPSHEEIGYVESRGIMEDWR